MSALRIVTVGVLGLTLLLSAAPSVRAHGGAFRGGTPNPGPQVPPGHIPPPPVPTTPPATRRPAAPRVQKDDRDWTVWWRYNATRWDPRPSLSAQGPITPSETEGGPRVGAQDPVILNLFRFVTDPAARWHPKLVAAALIAWARTASDDEVVSVLRRYALDRWAPLEIRESAVLGLGLLRRSGAERPLDDAGLAATRDLLFVLIDDERSPLRISTFAVYALALLADQPGGAGVAKGLAFRLRECALGLDMRVALIIALGLQPPEDASTALRQELVALALDRRNGEPARCAVERGHALHALSRLDPARAAVVIRRVMTRKDMVVAGATALAEIAPRLDAVQRESAARRLLALQGELSDERLRGHCLLALGALLGADLQSPPSGVLERTEVDAHLREVARKGSPILRPYAAIALGIAASGRHAGPQAVAFRKRTRDTLVRGLRVSRSDDLVLAGYAVAAGICRAEGAASALRRYVVDVNRKPVQRVCAARALGQLGGTDARTVEALVEASKDRISHEVYVESVRALGLLGTEAPHKELRKQLDGDPTSGVMVSVALSRGYLGDRGSVDRLVTLAKDDGAGLNVRTFAIVALGLLHDPEHPRSRARLRWHAYVSGLTHTLRKMAGIL